MTTPPPTSVLIIGAGVFGLSTTLSLLDHPRYSNTKITILDASPTLPNPSGSSVDASRIIRADYASHPYAALALKAQKHWRDTSDTGWGGQGRYHEPGFLLTADLGKEAYVKDCLANVRKLAESGAFEASKIEELVDQDAIRRASGFAGVSGDKGYVNWTSGWADAEACVRYAIEKVKAEGKERVTMRSGSHVRKLLYEGGRCVGAELEEGEQVLADLIVVAAGAWSPTLVNLRGRAVATGQALAYLDITQEEEDSMAHRPTIMNMSRGMFIIPPRRRELKIARHGFGYLNPKQIELSEPNHEDQTTHDGNNNHLPTPSTILVSVPSIGISIPPEGLTACRSGLTELIPTLSARPFTRTRVCWYCDTPTGDFLVSHHPRHDSLFVATGGSGHGFKFFPVIGDKIVDAIERHLEPELQQLWRWREEAVPDFDGTEDGSRSGARGMVLEEEMRRASP